MNNTPNPYTYQLSQQKPIQAAGGTVKIIDQNTFNVAVNIAAAEVTVEPGRMRSVSFTHTKELLI